MKIGFVGLGNLGAPMAENLLEKGHTLYVYNRTASKAQPLANKGALICTSAKEISTICDIVFSVVSDDAALNHITQGNEGIATNLKAGGIHVSISTVLPATSTHLYEIHQQYNNHYVACPVMGRPEAVRARKLNFIIAGDHSAVQLIKPFLQDVGATGIWEFGENVSHANVAKLCSNFLIASAIEALAEGINLAKKSGMDAQQWMNMLTQTIFNSSVYINYGNIILKEAYQPPAFSLRLGLKDINLVMEQAAETKGEMMFGKALQERMHQCVANGLGEYDWTAIALALKEKSVV